MRQMENTISIPVIILTLGFFSLLSFAQDSSLSLDDRLVDSELDFDGRPHDGGLGKRIYGYISEYKRLPVYNFGLGKRSYLNDFGKQSGGDEIEKNLEEYDEYSNNENEERMPELELYDDDYLQSLDKRNARYSFGLGKRLHRYDFGLGKRQYQRYDFGLGRRSLPKNKKNKMTKRPQNVKPKLYNFGLGKRSVPQNLITKRDVHGLRVPEVKTSGDLENKVNNTVELESHENMGHSMKSQLSKRSPSRYSFEDGKKPAFRASGAFSRQFRKPLYNFGLGKRTFSKDEISKISKSSNN